MPDLIQAAWQAVSSVPNLGLYLAVAWLLYIPWLVAWVVSGPCPREARYASEQES